MTHTTTIEKIYAGISQGDLQPLFDNFGEHGEWIEAENTPYSTGAPIIGAAGAAKDVFAKTANDFADFRVDIKRIVDGGETILVEGRYVATTTSGAELDAIMAHVWDFEGDTIVRFQQYTDTSQWQKVLNADA
jgi:ketosteroid isomerase-like protein